MRKFCVPALLFLLFLFGACRNMGQGENTTDGDGRAGSDKAISSPQTALVLFTLTSTSSPTSTPTNTATPTSTSTPLPTPTLTPTPRTDALLESARTRIEYGDFTGALDIFRQILGNPGASMDQQILALLGEGQVLLKLEAYPEAEQALIVFLNTYPDSQYQDKATFWLAQARKAQQDWEGTLSALEAYLAVDDTLIAYVKDLEADAYLALNDHAASISALEMALTGASTESREVQTRERLANAYLNAGNLENAITQYETVRTISDDPLVLARMDYLTGYALSIHGQTDESHLRYLHAVQNYPQAYDSYLALIELIDAGYPVGDFERALVDYHAGACIPAINAFYRHFEADPFNHPADGHLYVARCYHDLGDPVAALAELDTLIETHPDDPLWDDAWMEKAQIQVRRSAPNTAIETYLALVQTRPNTELAPTALWRAARLLEQLEAWMDAHDLYRRLVGEYPDFDDAPEALFRAGLMALKTGEKGVAAQNWDALVHQFPTSDWYAPALLWLTQTLPEEEISGYQEKINGLLPDSYYAIRAGDLISGVIPFSPPLGSRWIDPSQEQIEREVAEKWLQGWLTTEISQESLGPPIAGDARWKRGSVLWELGLFDAAKAELESLRIDLVRDPISMFQLAIAFRDLGLYRSSILCANALIRLSPAATVLEVPRYVAQFAYPIYYDDLVLQLSAEYAVDPLLIFSLIRQESLFESFARSWAVAQGLMQIIPGTGEYIAGKLAWPDYQNQDLYKPLISLNFGVYYLAEQLETFDRDPFAALAAYNGGPGNAIRWVDIASGDPDLFVEIIDFSETRLYVQRIYTHYTYYRFIYGESSSDT